VEYAGCPAKASEDDVDDEVMVTTCSFEDGKWRHKESDDRKTESTLQTVISCESTVAKIERTKRPMANDQPGGAERPGSITLRRFRVVSSESDWRWLLTMEKKFWCCELWHVKKQLRLHCAFLTHPRKGEGEGKSASDYSLQYDEGTPARF
jgi:hypothetical protein